MKIFYWSPFLSNIATIDAVIRSIKSINKFDDKKFYKAYLLDATGEWQTKKKKIENLNIIKIYKKNFYNYLPKGSFLKSRISQILIFITCIFKLKSLLKKEKPNYLIAHLIISLPLFLFSLNDFKTKLIIRISGTPKLNFLRKFFWKILSKGVYKVTCPTLSSLNQLKQLKIFPENKLTLLYDPIISVKEINKKKKDVIENNFEKDKYILSIGRLTKQKNFTLLINAFSEITKSFPHYNLVIIGDGEERKDLEKLITFLELTDKVKLMGYKSNIYNYLDKAYCFISSSLYEDPGFVLIEAGYSNKLVFAADSNTGPSEILAKSKRGILYENDNHEDLVKKFIHSQNMPLDEKKIKIFNLKKYSSNFTIYKHYKKLVELLD